MFTDQLPRLKALLAQFRASDQLASIDLPQDDRLPRTRKSHRGSHAL